MLFANGVWKEQGKVYLQLLKRGVCASESFSQRSWMCGTFVLYVYWSNVAVLTAISDHSLQNILVVGHTGIGQPVQRTWSKQRERAFLSGGDSLLSEYAACGWVSSWWHLVTREAVSCTYSCWTRKTSICSVALFTRTGRLDIPATVQHVFMVSSAKLSCVHFFFFLIQDGMWYPSFACEVGYWMCLLRATALLWIEGSAASLYPAACAGLVLHLLAWRVGWYLLTPCSNPCLPWVKLFKWW